jgi:hypothetical protein
VGSGEVLVFDTGPLSQCARMNCLWVLKAVVGVGERTAIPTDNGLLP